MLCYRGANMPANNTQVGGTHYQRAFGTCPKCGSQIQHWDLYAEQPYLIGQITKYVTREKGGLQDYEKAAHFLQKLVETRYPGVTVHISVEDNRPEQAADGRSVASGQACGGFEIPPPPPFVRR